MPFALLLLLLLVTLHDDWPNPLGLEPLQSLLPTWAGMGLIALAAEFAGLFTCRALRRDPSQRSGVMRFFARWKRWHLAALLGYFLISLYVFAWGGTIQHLESSLPIPGFKIAVLGPLIAGLVCAWISHYAVERTNHEIAAYPEFPPFISRGAYLGLQARHHLLFLLPAMLLLIAHDGVFLLVPALKQSEHGFLMALVGIVLLALALLLIPLFLRLFLGLRSLPDGPLRDRLLATADRLGFRISDILVWNTRRGVANAMVTGVVPWLRYVVFTDHLLQELTEDEIEAVFGHEVGHMKHHHMFFYMVFILGSLMLLGGLWSAGDRWLQSLEMPDWVSSILDAATWHTVSIWFILAVVAGYMLLVFGWLSRRCERQADVFGCKTASPTVFVSALEKVADLNGIPRECPGFLSWWQHSTIADRIGFIRRMESDPALEAKFQRRLGWMKWGVAVGLIVLVAVLGMNWDVDWWKLL